MAHFETGATGSRGRITRQGTQQSGVSAFVRNAKAQISVDMHHNGTEDHEDATIIFSPGPHSSGSSLSINLGDIDSIVEALNSGDPKITKIWTRILSEFDKLGYEAFPAVLRAKAKADKDRQGRERERKRHAKERDQIIRRLTGPAKLALHKLCDVEWDEQGMPIGTSKFSTDEGNLRYDDDGETPLITAYIPGSNRAWHKFPFDLDKLEWVLGDTPDFYGMAAEIEESGYGWRVQEVAA